MFKHNWAWIKLATYNSSTVMTRNLRNPRDYATLRRFSLLYVCLHTADGVATNPRQGALQGGKV